MATKTLLTLEQFEKLPDDGMRHELDEGELISMTFPSPRHNLVVFQICKILDAFVRQHSLGIVFPSDTGFLLSVDPGTVRGPDVSFVRGARISQIDLDQSRIAGAPDLAVEVFSQFDTKKAMGRKVQQYLKAGTHTVWVVHPDSREVHVIEGAGPVGGRWLDQHDTLEAPDLLPGFSISVSVFFN